MECAQQPDLVGKRVVGEINVNWAGFSCADAVFQRNHAPGRCALHWATPAPTTNCHRVLRRTRQRASCVCQASSDEMQLITSHCGLAARAAIHLVTWAWVISCILPALVTSLLITSSLILSSTDM